MIYTMPNFHTLQQTREELSCGSPRLWEIAPSPLYPGTPNIAPPPSLLRSEVPRHQHKLPSPPSQPRHSGRQ